MDDQILQGFVNDFIAENEFTILPEDKSFEHFVNYIVVSKKYPRDFDIEDINTGGSDDIGFDGASFIVNGNIISKPEEIDFLLRNNGSLDVSILIIQTKNSAKFKGDQVGTLIFGLKSFFNKTAAILENDEIRNFRAIKDKIYANTISLNSSPTLEVYFVTKGEWKEPAPIRGRVDFELSELKKQSLFSSIAFEFYDAEKLKNSYRELKRKIVKDVFFNKHVALPEIPGVRQSFVGGINVNNYISLITDSEGNLLKSLFYDNVRDFQGTTSVNLEIAETLKDPNTQASLCILNNGITIIAKKVEQIGEKMKLTDFQIVNGCQTSNVIYANRTILSKDTTIVIKVIETTDQEVSANVIKATNRQTEVKLEAFESLSPFHKDLEEYFKAKSRNIEMPIFYERRSKQYEDIPSIKKSQVVTLSAQIKAYTSTVLSQPQSTHRYFSEILESNRRNMFISGQRIEPYYLSSLLLNRIEYLLRSEEIQPFFKGFKFHIVFIAYSLISGVCKEHKKDLDWAINEYAKKANYLPAFKKACNVISTSLKESRINKEDAMRSKAFTELIK